MGLIRQTYPNIPSKVAFAWGGDFEPLSQWLKAINMTSILNRKIMTTVAITMWK